MGQDYRLEDALDFLKSATANGEDAELLRKSVGTDLKAIIDEFYDALLKTSAGGMFRDPQYLERIKVRRKAHWERFFQDAIAAEALEDSHRIGRLHRDVNLPSSWYVASYGWSMVRMVRSITRRYAHRPRKLDATLTTLLARMFADMTVSISAYEQASVEQAVAGIRDVNSNHLGRLAEALASINDTTRQLAFLQRNSSATAMNGQTISSAATELVGSVEEIARNSESAATEAGDANESAANGRSAITSMSDTITNIASAVEETSENVRELADASDQIGQILNVIEGIAEQTNLLALNATIEAARAGEAGKGFAVVAAEVKSLANQTARSTDDIAKRISALREGMATIQQTMQHSTDAVEQGKAAISEASSQMGVIADQVGSVSRRMVDISAILGQQKGSSSEIARSIENVASMAGESDQLVRDISQSMRRAMEHFSNNAREMFDPDSNISLCHMAKIDHVLFKQRIIDTCMGADTWEIADVPDHHHCRLGKWYDAIGDRALKGHPSFVALTEPHQAVHHAAKAALTALAAGDIEAVSVHMGELERASVDVFTLLDDIAAVMEEREHGKPGEAHKSAVA